MSRQLPSVISLLLLVPALAYAASPRVLSTSPDNGEIDVSPEVKEIRIEFDQPMNPRGRSIVGGGDAFPKISGDVQWLDEKTFIIPITLKPDHHYQLGINSDTFKGFSSKTGEAAEWYPI